MFYTLYELLMNLLQRFIEQKLQICCLQSFAAVSGFGEMTTTMTLTLSEDP